MSIVVVFRNSPLSGRNSRLDRYSASLPRLCTGSRYN